jgi:hypothetical protein
MLTRADVDVLLSTFQLGWEVGDGGVHVFDYAIVTHTHTYSWKEKNEIQNGHFIRSISVTHIHLIAFTRKL